MHTDLKVYDVIHLAALDCFQQIWGVGPHFGRQGIFPLGFITVWLFWFFIRIVPTDLRVIFPCLFADCKLRVPRFGPPLGFSLPTS